jgi:large subunit ribosomal protein L29
MKKVRERLGKLREMSPDELEGQAADLRQKVWAQQLQQVTGQLQDPHKVREARRELARVLTIQSERASAARKTARRTGSGR